MLALWIIIVCLLSILCFWLRWTLLDERKTRTLVVDSLKAQMDGLITKHRHDIDAAVEEARADTLRRSRSTLRGQATEHLAPFMMEGMNPKDARFMGSPVDYLIIDGLSAVLDGEEEPITVYLVDIKTGKSQMTKAQRRIRDAIQAGRLVFGVFNPDDRSFVEYKYLEE